MSKLKQYRTQRQLTQKQLAELLGVNRTTYVHWETGKVKLPGSHIFPKLSQVFGQDITLEIFQQSHGAGSG